MTRTKCWNGGPKALTGFTFGNYSSSSSGVFAAAGEEGAHLSSFVRSANASTTRTDSAAAAGKQLLAVALPSRLAGGLHYHGYAHHRPIPPWTARTGRRDIARGRTYSRLGRGPGGVTDLHAARPTRGGHHCREVPRKDDTTATFSLRLERAKWAEIFFRLIPYK